MERTGLGSLCGEATGVWMAHPDTCAGGAADESEC